MFLANKIFSRMSYLAYQKQKYFYLQVSRKITLLESIFIIKKVLIILFILYNDNIEVYNVDYYFGNVSKRARFW